MGDATLTYTCKADDLKTDRRYSLGEDAICWQDEGKGEEQCLYTAVTLVSLNRLSGNSHKSGGTGLVNDIDGNTVNVISEKRTISGSDQESNYYDTIIKNPDKDIYICTTAGQSDDHYAKFIIKLHQRLADANKEVSFVRGSRFIFYALIIAMCTTLVLATWGTWTLTNDGGWIFALLPALTGLIVFVVLLMFAKGARPQNYDPYHLPDDLLPENR